MTIAIYLLLTFLILIALSMFVTVIIIAVNIKRKNDIEITKIDMNITPSEEDFNLIDIMVKDEVTKYHVLKTEPNDIQYINDDYIQEMQKYILTNVLNNISPIYLGKLKYIYNPDKLEDIIYEKVQIAVISYSVDINSSVNNSSE